MDLTFFNQTTTDVTLFIQWRRDARLESERIRLGSLRGGATETFTVPYLGDLVTLSLDVPPSPPRTASGPGSAPTARLLEEERRGGSTGPVSTVMIDPGESIGWAIRGIAPPSVTSWRIE